MTSTFEPFNIFSHRINARGVIDALRAVASEVRVVGPEGDWTQATAYGPKAFLKRRARLVIGHDSQFYDRQDWGQYLFQMANYFSRFPDAPRKPEILRLIRSFRFLLAFPEIDLDVHSDDSRVAWVRAICQHLDGVIFMPSMLMDSAGRVLIAANGEYDPEAVLPAIPDDIPDWVAEAPVPEEEVAEPEPPTAERVARRAAVLAAVGNRGLIENERKGQRSGEESRLAMLEWIDAAGISDEVEPNEWEALQRPLGRMDKQTMINAVWRLEGLGVLLWALSLYELPPYDVLVSPPGVFKAVGQFDARATCAILANATLKSADELAAYHNHATMSHWRIRNFRIHPGPVDFVAMSKDCWIGTFDITRFRIKDNDVVVRKRPIAKADAHSIDAYSSAAMERHLAINWISGYSTLYSKTDTST